MSRSEIYVDTANSNPHSRLYNWLSENGVPFGEMFAEIARERVFVPPFEGVSTKQLIEGEELTLKFLPMMGKGGYSIRLSVGDKNEAVLLSQGLIPEISSEDQNVI